MSADDTQELKTSGKGSPITAMPVEESNSAQLTKVPSNAALDDTIPAPSSARSRVASPVSFSASTINQRVETPLQGSSRGGSIKGNSRSNSPITFENPQGSPEPLGTTNGSSKRVHTPSQGSGRGSRSESPIFFPTSPITIEQPSSAVARSSSPIHDTMHLSEAEPLSESTHMEQIAEEKVHVADNDDATVQAVEPEGAPVTADVENAASPTVPTLVEAENAPSVEGAVNETQTVPSWKLRSKRTGSILDRITTCLKNGQYDIDIAQLELDEWPQDMLIVTKVKEIIAFKNNLTTVPTLREFRSLEHLDLSRNALVSLESIEIYHLTRLRHLDVSRNELLKLPDGLTKCIFLEKLVCHRNRLESFPTDMIHLRQLRYIDASYNNITKLGNVLEGLPNLDELNLSNNEALERGTGGGSMGGIMMGPRTQRLFDKRTMFAAKRERRTIITRSLGVQLRVTKREQELIQEGLR